MSFEREQVVASVGKVLGEGDDSSDDGKDGDIDKVGTMSQEEEARLKSKVARGAWSVAKDRAQIAISNERAESYEAAFLKIQEATKIESLDELVDKFIEAEERNYKLFNFVNQLNVETERMESQVSDVAAEIEKFKGQGISGDNQRKKVRRRCCRGASSTRCTHAPLAQRQRRLCAISRID